MNEDQVWESAAGRTYVLDELIQKIREFPVTRSLAHCDTDFATSPFDFYANCLRCGTEIKLRAFSAAHELEDVFDAVFEWLINPDAAKLFTQRQNEIKYDSDHTE